MTEPHQRTGWEADTPVEDTYLRRFLVNWTTGIEAHGVPAGGRVLRRDDLAAVDIGRPAGGEAPPVPSPLRVEEVQDESGLRGFELAIVRGFESPDLEAHGPGAMFDVAILDDDRFRHWVGWEGDIPVCGASAFVARIGPPLRSPGSNRTRWIRGSMSLPHDGPPRRLGRPTLEAAHVLGPSDRAR